MTVLLGSHVERTDPLQGAQQRGASVIQINLSAPQTWRAPSVKPDEQALADSGIPIWVHAPYLANPASVNPELRVKTRACLQQQTDAAARVGARGLVVHGGHPTGAGTVDDGIRGWLEVLDGWVPAVPIHIENTAGGNAAVARHFEALDRLFTALRREGHEPGFVLDTCHAHAGGMVHEGIVDRVLSVTGRIDLVHMNDSRDAFASGRDRHANLGEGFCPQDWLVDVAITAGAPVVVETPGGAEAMASDIKWLQDRIAARSSGTDLAR